MNVKICIITALVVAMVARATGEDHSEVRSARIDKYGESVLLYCSSDPESEPGIFVYWILPDLYTLEESKADGSLELFGNYSLYIPSVEQENTGDYICHMKDASTMEPKFYKTHVYLYVPTLWEIYRMNTIVGASAAGIFLVLATLFCCICNHTWDKRHASDGSASSGDEEYQGKTIGAEGGVELIEKKGYQNSGYVAYPADGRQVSTISSSNQGTIVSVAADIYPSGAQGITPM